MIPTWESLHIADGFDFSVHVDKPNEDDVFNMMQTAQQLQQEPVHPHCMASVDPDASSAHSAVASDLEAR